LVEPPVRGDKCTLLVVDDEPYILPTLSALLAHEFEVATADCAEAGQQVFARQPIDIVLTDQKMPRMTGVQFLEWVRANYPKTVRLLMTGYAELDDAVEAINRSEVYYYLMKPWRTEDLHRVLRNAAEKCHLVQRNENLNEELKLKNVELRQSNLELEKRVAERTLELQQRNRELEMLALTDPLTGLLNRRAIEGVVNSELKRHERYPSPLAIGLIDIDHFKQVNSRYLLTGGDEVLKVLGKILANSLRNVDALGRVGGEEFLVVAPETDMDGALILAERIRSTVEQTPIRYQGDLIEVTVSVGFAVWEGEVASDSRKLFTDDLDAAADYKRMYHEAARALGDAKNLGRNRSIIRSVKGVIVEA
jgi:diguanylate cyclase (GGDEF)-like protein